MTELQVIYPPNKPLQRVLLPSKKPVCYDHLYFIDANDKDEIILGCSNVVGAYWESTLFFYNNGLDVLSHQFANYYISGTSISDAIFIPNTTKVVLAEDTSHLKLLSITEEPSLKCLDLFNTNARVEQLVSWDSSEKIISCGGNYISVWDLQNDNVTCPIEEYKNIHTDVVKSVTTKPQDNFVFATASLDRKACIWDTRMNVPATVLYQNEFSGLTSIAWDPTQNDFVVVGSVAGDIYGLDVRHPKEFNNYRHCLNGSIHRTKFNNLGHLAVCGDSSQVYVLKPEDTFQIVCDKSDHTNYIRGLCWYNTILYTCGFDKQIFRYQI